MDKINKFDKSNNIFLTSFAINICYIILHICPVCHRTMLSNHSVFFRFNRNWMGKYWVWLIKGMHCVFTFNVQYLLYIQILNAWYVVLLLYTKLKESKKYLIKWINNIHRNELNEMNAFMRLFQSIWCERKYHFCKLYDTLW